MTTDERAETWLTAKETPRAAKNKIIKKSAIPVDAAALPLGSETL